MKRTIGLIGKKLGMTSVFGDDGKFIPVTVIQAGPCPVIQKKVQEKDGYSAIQIGFDAMAGHRLNKPARGHQAKAGMGYYRKLMEFSPDNVDEYEPGQELSVEIFKPGDRIKLTGTSKGKGFAGVMKRWNFSGLPRTHGHEKVHRSPGAIGQCADPGKVFKGRKMPGRMGNKTVSYKNAEIISVRSRENVILVKGQVPGPKDGFVVLQKQD
ncbi:50S ribosomal protein L3 [Desulfonatronospira sp.]|uniref:50S ribosomal protein L3 n=1 Tax=Desulfonatronospira sp. TaxID=1962951 RepID=UPI0025C4216C|nr:50S ribosomal protein L3 [Desulfonatronospira sp.]